MGIGSGRIEPDVLRILGLCLDPWMVATRGVFLASAPQLLSCPIPILSCFGVFRCDCFSFLLSLLPLGPRRSLAWSFQAHASSFVVRAGLLLLPFVSHGLAAFS